MDSKTNNQSKGGNTILVKKADGTTVRMTLDELKSLKSKVQSHKSDNTKIEEKNPPTPASLPGETKGEDGERQDKEEIRDVRYEIKNEKKEEGKLKLDITKLDAETKTHLVEDKPSLKSQSTTGQPRADKVIKPALSEPKGHKSIDVKKEDKREERRNKGVASASSRLDKLAFVTPKDQSSQKQSNLVHDKWEEEDHKSLLDDSFHAEDLPNKVMTIEEMKNSPTPASSTKVSGGQEATEGQANLPMKDEGHDLATSVPVKDIFVDEAKASKAKLVQPKDIEKSRNQEIKKSRNQAPRLDQRTGSAFGSAVRAKPVIQDIVRPEKKEKVNPIIGPTANKQAKPAETTSQEMDKISIGPVDELKRFSLTDFRRLGVSADASGEKLLDKFKTLEHDSYLLFMDGAQAWYNSPLYTEYQEIISQALKQGKTISEFLSTKDSSQQLKMEEFNALVKLNQSIT